MAEETVDLLEGDDLPNLDFSARRRRLGDSSGIDPMTNSLPSSPAPVSLPEVQYVAPSYATKSRGGGRTPTSAGSLRKYHSVQDMVASLPELQSSTSQLRVERTEPEWSTDPNTGEKIRVCGFLGFESPTTTVEQIGQKHGGYKFRVFGTVERQPPDNRGGPPVRVDIAVAEFDIPAEPNLDTLPYQDSEVDMSFGRRAQSPFFMMQQPQPMQTSPDGGIVAKLADRFISQNQQPMNHGQQLPTSAFDTVVRQSERAIDATTGLAQKQIEQLQREKELLLQRLDSMQDQMRESMQQQNQANKTPEIVAMAQALGALNTGRNAGISTEEREAIHRAHEREVERLSKEAQIEKEALRREVERESIKHQEQIRELQSMFDRERLHMREEADRRERIAKEIGEQNVLRVREMLEMRISQMERDRQAELSRIQDHHQIMSKTQETSMEAEFRLMKGEMDRMAMMLQEKDRELQGFRAEKNKPITEQVQGILETAELLRPPQDNQPEGETMKDKLLISLVQKGPELLGALGGMVQQRKANAQQLPEQAQVRQLPPPAMQQQAAAPPRRAFQRPVFAPTEGSLPMAPASPRPVQRPQQAQQPEYFQNSNAPSMPAPPAMVMQPPAYAPATIEQPPPASQPEMPAGRTTLPMADEAWSGLDFLPLDADTRSQLFASLEAGCASDMDPAKFTQALVAQYGAEVCSIVPSIAPAEQILAGIKSAPATKDTILAKRKGQQFLQAVWAELEQLAAKMQA